MTIAVVGAGAFGTSLAIALARDGSDVVLWGRDREAMAAMQDQRSGGKRLPGFALPDSLVVTSNPADLPRGICLVSVPTQVLGAFLQETDLTARYIVACCKGIDRSSGLGPVETIKKQRPDTIAGMLTGPSFAVDIAAGLPTALVLACQDDTAGAELQASLTRPTLRLYRTTDVTGAELGGALKNVVALAAGMTVGAGLGDSARASVIARGFAEMTRFATAKGAMSDTLNGLSGLGDLVLTCTSEKSRNFAAGMAFGRGDTPPSATIEGIATSLAIRAEAQDAGLDLPLLTTVAQVVGGELDISSAIATLLARPVGKE